jgi:phosphatidylglycerophosphate synthase
MNDATNRRPLKTRQQAWAHKLAHYFVAAGITPNQMSLASIGCSILGALAYTGTTLTEPPLQSVLYILAAVFIQLRLLSNMLDGLMAIEEGKKTVTGVLYNEMPDRVADVVFLVAAGCACGWPDLGWICAVLAVLTAYIRALGVSFGFAQDYSGPMAKPHRMFALMVGSVLAAFLPHLPVLAITLAVIALGAVVTAARRTLHIADNLAQKGHD